MRHLLVALSLVSVLAGGCSTVENPVTGRAERTVMDERAEIAEGRKAHPQVLAEYGVVKDAKLQAYVDAVGQRLAKQSHRPDLDWHFTVLDSAEINAFALPGGYVYVTRGIMAYMDSEADLAGVLGHEIGHVTARHGAQRATRQQAAGLGVLAATVLGAVLESRGLGGAGDLAQQASQGVAAGYIASYSRDQELQADKLGAEYLSRIGHDPAQMAEVIRLLLDQERFAADQARADGRAAPQSPDWLASHPSNEQRLRDIRAAAAEFKAPAGSADEGRRRYLQAIDGMLFGDSPEQGVVRGRHFLHEPLGFAITAPPGWKIRNAPQALALVSADGSAGLVVRNVPPRAGDSHEQIIRNLVKPDSGRLEKRNLNGQPATHFVGTRRDEQGRVQRVALTVVSGPQDREYLFIHGARDAQAAQRWARQIDEAEASFRPLSAAERAAAKPWTVQSVPLPRGGFAELARASPLGDDAERQLQLLNGVYGGGDLKPGQLVKTVR